jgi:drug/metabolite transporter (DMT)-like permease
MFVNLGSVLFFKEKMKASQWLSLFLAMSGLVMLLWGEMNVRTVSSVGWGLAAALTYSGYVLISGRIQKNVEPLSSSLYVITSAAFALWGFHHPEYNRLLNFEVEQYLYIIGIAVFSTILPLTLFLSGMQKLSSSKASIIVMIEPVVATIAGWIILGETLRPLQMAGAFIIFLSLIFVSK